MTTDEILTQYAELYRTELVPQQLALYLAALDQYSPQEVRAAMRQLSRESKWLPRPAEIIAVMDATRAEARRQQSTAALTSVAAEKPLRGQWRVPAGMSIMEYIESLRDDGLSLDEIAARLSGPEDAASEPRYRCHHCRDTGYTRVWHPDTMRAVYREREHRGRTCTLPCDCERGKAIADQGKRWSYHYQPDKMVRVTGDRQCDERQLQAKAKAMHDIKKHAAFTAYESNPHDDF